MIYLVRDNGPQRDNALIYLFHYTLDFEGAVGGSLGMCPRDGTHKGVRDSCPRVAVTHLAPLFMNGQGATSSEVGSRGGGLHTGWARV